MFLDFDNERLYNQRSADSCPTSSLTNPMAKPDPDLSLFSVEIMGSLIIQCGGVREGVLSNKCYVGNFENPVFSWQVFHLGTGMEHPFMHAIGGKVYVMYYWIIRIRKAHFLIVMAQSY